MVGSDATVADTGIVQPCQRCPRTRQQCIVDLSAVGSERRTDALGDEERVAAFVHRRCHEGSDQRPLAFGIQRQVRLVLDLMTPIDRDVAATGTVEHEPPHLDEELAVPRVASVDADVELAIVGGPSDGGDDSVAYFDPGGLGIDADRAQRFAEVAQRHRAVGRTEKEVDECASGPSDCQCTQARTGLRDAEDERREPRRRDQPSTERAQRADEVRTRDGDRSSAGRERE